MGLFSRKKKPSATGSAGGGGSATLRHRDTGMIVLNVDQVLPVGRQVVATGTVQVELSAGDWLVFERGASRHELRLKKVESGGQLSDHAPAGMQAGLLFEPKPSVLRWMLDASL